MRSSKKVHALVLLAALGLLAACQGGSTGKSSTSANVSASSSQEDIGEVIARVNGEPIGAKEFQEAAARYTPKGDTLTDEERKEILDRLVAQKLLYKEAIAKGLCSDPKVRQVLVHTLVRQEVHSKVHNSDFTDEQLQQYFEQHREDFVIPEKVQIKRILIRVTDERPDEQARALAEKLRKQVAADPQSFKDVAMQYSEDPYRRRGGEVGFVSRKGKPGLDPAIVEKAFSLEVGQVSEVFKTTDGYNIIYVPSRREATERTFQQVKGAVLRQLKNERIKELYDQYVAELEKGAQIQVDEEALSKVEVKPLGRPLGFPGLGLHPAMPLGGSKGAAQQAGSGGQQEQAGGEQGGQE